MTNNINDLDKVFEFKDAYTVVKEYLAEVKEGIKACDPWIDRDFIRLNAQKDVLEEILSTFTNDRAMLSYIEQAQDREDRA